VPYYISPYIGTGTRLDPFRPFGSDQPGWSAIDLRPDGSILTGRCLLHLPVHNTDPQLNQLADDLDETLGLVVQNRLQNLLNLTLGQTQFKEVVAELLTFHARTDGTRWKPLQVNHRGLMEIYLGGLLMRWRHGAVGALPATDNFNRADENPLAGNWTTAPGAFAGLKIVSNAVDAVTGGEDCAAYWNADAFSTDHYTQLTSGSTASSTKGPAVRVRTATQLDMYLWSLNISGTNSIQKIVNDAFTLLLTTNITFISTDVMKLAVSGSTLTVYKNDVSQGTVTNTALTTGVSGMFADSGGAGRQLDNWQADDVAAPGGGFRSRIAGGLVIT